VNPDRQRRALHGGADVIIATPGRLLDLMGQGAGRFGTLETLVLDEADRMLDMGFLPDVKRILSALPRRRQTLLFSATLPRPIVQLSKELLEKPVRLQVDQPSAPAEGIEQAVLPVPQRLKSKLLLEMLQRSDIRTALVFTRTKHRANRLARFLDGAGVPTERIHGNRTQPQRQRALTAFKDGKVRVLVATDIAARGIDVEALPHVVNFDVPGQPEDYIHRVGRTARAKSTGEALTLMAPAEESDMRNIERVVGRDLRRHHVTGFDYSAATDAPHTESGRPRGRGPKSKSRSGRGQRRNGNSRPRRRRARA
jgi:ATP-dependent RNA helicase RhlE